MIFGSIQSMAIALGIGLVVGATSSGLIVKRYVDNDWTAKVEKQKTEASTKLQEVTERAIVAERAHSKISTELEIQNEISKTKLNDAYRSNRHAADVSGGLRDPGSRPGSSCPSGTPANAAQQPSSEPTGAALSTEATQFLLDFAYDADQAAQYAGTCHAWVKRLEGVKNVD